MTVGLGKAYGQGRTQRAGHIVVAVETETWDA
jgi:hypothetical protein